MPWYKREKWALVKSFKIDYSPLEYVHLFESSKGNRKIEHTVSGRRTWSISDLKNSVLYQETIYRWLCGRRDLDIPTYDQVPAEETANVLRGKQ